MRVTQSFSLSLQEIEQLRSLTVGDNRSRFLGVLIQNEYQRSMKHKMVSDGQTILETHISDAATRMKRVDNKCNPHHINGRCLTCWSDEE